LTPIRSTIVTVFSRFGETRDNAGRPLARVQCKTVGSDAKAPIEPRYTGSPATARDLDALVDKLDALGCDFRIRQVFRSNREQEEVYRKYQTWKAAGCPKPGQARWSNTTMSTAAASAPNRSHHGWGGAIDIGLGNLRFEDGTTGDAALARFWDLAGEHGFTPIISEPRMSRSEAWHFDHLGPMKAVRDLFYAHRSENPDYASAAGNAAEVACVLMGTHAGMGQMARMVQARLLAHGVFVGLPDGKIGPMTMRGLAAVGITTTGPVDPATAIAKLDELEIGTATLAAL
jgi:hypothetical protein